MRRGERILYQATFFDGEFIGHADFLRRVEEPSRSAAYSYEVIDTKLALTPKALLPRAALQLQRAPRAPAGTRPEFGHVVFGNGEERRFRINDYMAYYRHLKRAFLDFVRDPAWSASTTAARVSRISAAHCAFARGTTPARASATRRRSFEPRRLDAARSDRQARSGRSLRVTAARAGPGRAAAVRHEPRNVCQAPPPGLTAGTAGDERSPIYELLAHEPPIGFALLPAPRAGDVFFDMEGDPLYEPGRGLEYLFGCWMPDDDRSFAHFGARRATTRRRAFEVVRRLRHGAAEAVPGAARLPLRKLREVGAAPSRTRAPHARGRDRRPSCATKCSSISSPSCGRRWRFQRTATGSRTWSAFTISARETERQERRRVDRHVRALVTGRATARFSTISSAITATTADRRICYASGCSRAALEAELDASAPIFRYRPIPDARSRATKRRRGRRTQPSSSGRCSRTF